MIKRSATTLVEIILYFALIAVFLTVVITFSLQIINSSHQVSTESDLNTELDLIRSRLSTEIRSANGIDVDASTLNDPNGVLVLTMDDVSVNPTSFFLTNGDLQVQYGSNAPIVLNSPEIDFESLSFQVYSSSKAPDHIVIDAVVTLPSDVDVLDASADFHLALSLRP